MSILSKAPQTPKASVAPTAPSAGKAGGDGSAPTKGGKAIVATGKAAAPAASALMGIPPLDINALRMPHTEPPPRRTLPPEDPPLVGIYSRPDGGKTTDFGFALPTDSTLWVCDPGALEPIHARCKYKPAYVYKDCRLVSDLTELLPWAAEQGYTSIALDDAAGKMQASLAHHRLSAPKAESGNADGFYPYNSLNDDLMAMRTEARYLGLAVFFNFWEDPPKNQKGKQKKGGAGIPGNKGKEIIVTFLDMLLRGGSNATFKPWPGVYLRYPITDPNWTTKDRYDLGMPEMPQNLGEIMRYVGFTLEGSPWRPERRWDWQEGVVDEIAVKMWHTGEDAAVGTEALTKLLEGTYPGLGKMKFDDGAIEWTMRDAVDRVRLWRLVPRVDTKSIAARFGW